MHAHFNVERERYNKLFYKSYQNDKGALHFHSQIEIYFVDDGQMEVFVDGQRKLLSAGQISVALSYQPHSYRTPVASRSGVLIIPPNLCEEFVNAMRHRQLSSPFLSDPELCNQIRMYYERICTPGTNRIRQLGYIYVILGLLWDLTEQRQETPVNDPELSSRLLLHINEHFRENLSLKSLCAAFGYSSSYISRYFKDSFHIGLNQYICLVRLKNALGLMQENKLSITPGALESGFRSVRTFYRVFNQEFGCSPKEYLQRRETL